MLFAYAIVTVAAATVARTRHDNKGKTRTVNVTTVHSTGIVDAENMTEAREKLTGSPLYIRNDADIRWYIDPSEHTLAAATMAATRVLKTAYGRQCLDFILAALNSIYAGKPNPDADDLIGECAAAMVDAMQGKTGNVWTVYRAAYAAANRYIMSMRAVRSSTLADDINHYIRLSDDNAEAEFDADFNAGRFAEVYDIDRVNMATATGNDRTGYMSTRRAARRLIRISFAAMTVRQRQTVRAYARTGTVRKTAEVMGLKSIGTVGKHLKLARQAAEAATGKYAEPVDVAVLEKSEAERAVRAASVEYAGIIGNGIFPDPEVYARFRRVARVTAFVAEYNRTGNIDAARDAGNTAYAEVDEMSTALVLPPRAAEFDAARVAYENSRAYMPEDITTDETWTAPAAPGYLPINYSPVFPVPDMSPAAVYARCMKAMKRKHK